MDENRSLFDDFPQPERGTRADAPLPELMRPATLDEIVGLDDLVGPGRFLRNAIESDRIPSMIFWGPPGSGKTTLARIIAKTTKSRFVPFSAVTAGIKEIKQLMEESRRAREMRGTRTIVFIDEIHRFNRAQQDAFLPYVEAGDIVLIGATTENPSFEVNSALLSRTKVVVLPALERPQVLEIVRRAMEHEAVRSRGIEVTDESLDFLAATSGGDARQALNSLQLIVETASKDDGPIDVAKAKEILHRRSLVYDKSGEEHYNLISALHKSIRNGDADASIYWLARMLEGGEDPLYIARRLMRAASEDIGLADPGALRLAIAVKDAVHFMGMPEGAVALAQLAVYLAAAPKSNAIYTAYGAARHEVLQGDNPPVPLHIRNAPTSLMKDLGYGKGYQYAHDFEGETAPMDCLPESLKNRRFYEPKGSGLEAKITERLEELRKRRGK
ncbi:MAG: replication-associated recombination protein A [Thermoanaerobaculia bacterium]